MNRLRRVRTHGYQQAGAAEAIKCLELVQGSTPVALDCAAVDAGRDSGQEPDATP